MAQAVKPVDYSVRTEGVDVFGVNRWGARVTRLFWQAVQVVVFPVGIYRYFANRSVYRQEIHKEHVEDLCQLSVLKRVSIETADGVKLDAVTFRNARERRKPVNEQKWVIHVEEERGCYEEYIKDEMFASEEAQGIVFNPRGVGLSGGYRWSRSDRLVDLDAIVQCLKGKGVSEQNIELRGMGVTDEVWQSVHAHHPEVKISSASRLLSKPQQLDFKVISLAPFKQSVTRLFWEVVYTLLFPLRVARWAVANFVMLPSLSSFTARGLDVFRYNQMEGRRLAKSGVVVSRSSAQTVDGAVLDTCALMHPLSPRKAEEEKWIVYLPGEWTTYENVLDGLETMVVDSHANVYTGNYRGVGSSTGFPKGPQDLVRDAQTMVMHLIARGVKPEHILVHGASTSALVAAAVAAKQSGVHLCLDRPPGDFSEFIEKSVADVVEEHKLISRLHWKTRDRIAKIAGRIVASVGRFFGWTFTPEAAFGAVRGQKFVLHHSQDSEVTAPLHPRLGRGCVTIDLDSPTQLERPPAIESEEDLSDDEAVAKHPEPATSHRAFISITPGYQDGYQRYLASVRAILRIEEVEGTLECAPQ